MITSTDVIYKESWGNSLCISIDSKCDHDFVRFCESTDLKDILAISSKIKKSIGLEVEFSTFINIFPILKSELKSKIP